MKVKDLIAELSKLDPDLLVVTPDNRGQTYQREVKVRKGIYDPEVNWLYEPSEFEQVCRAEGTLLKGIEAISVEWH